MAADSMDPVSYPQALPRQRAWLLNEPLLQLTRIPVPRGTLEGSYCPCGDSKPAAGPAKRRKLPV
jgi:hypothetical protein